MKHTLKNQALFQTLTFDLIWQLWEKRLFFQLFIQHQVMLINCLSFIKLLICNLLSYPKQTQYFGDSYQRSLEKF